MSGYDLSNPEQWVVAHRGHASAYPENTLAALKAAAVCGVRFIEFDVQLTADGVPLLLHDDNFGRTGSANTPLAEVRAEDINAHPVGNPARFGARFADEAAPLLRDVVRFFASAPTLVPVVEIKPQSVRRCGVAVTVASVLQALTSILERCVIISFSSSVLVHARHLGAARVGWCLTGYDEPSRRRAVSLDPDYLLVDYRKLPPGDQPLWSGRWDWMCWEVTDAANARALRSRGVRYVESMACAELLAALG